MKIHAIYYVVGIAAIILAAGFLLSQYVAYKQFRLSQEKAIQDCVIKAAGKTTGFLASIQEQKCRDRFSQ